jgi:hypothetical protein
MAVIGPSTAMGSGVDASETFQSVLEDRLNREGTGTTHYEVLNFGVAGYSPLHELYQLQRKVFQFEPNAVLYLAHASNVDSASSQFVRMVQKEIVSSDAYLRDLARRTGIRRGTGATEARRRIAPYANELQEWVYRRIVEQCRERGIVPIFVYMPLVTESTEPWRAGQRRNVLQLARDAGFRIIDLEGVYGAYKPSELWIMKDDSHANALGNRLIGNRLHDLLQQGDSQALPGIPAKR